MCGFGGSCALWCACRLLHHLKVCQCSRKAGAALAPHLDFRWGRAWERFWPARPPSRKDSLWHPMARFGPSVQAGARSFPHHTAVLVARLTAPGVLLMMLHRGPTGAQVAQSNRTPHGGEATCQRAGESRTVWPSGLRRWLQAPVRKGVGSNPTAVTVAASAPVQRRAPSELIQTRSNPSGRRGAGFAQPFDGTEDEVLEMGLEPTISSLGGRRLIH